MAFPRKGFEDNPNVSWVKVGKTTIILQGRVIHYDSAFFLQKKDPSTNDTGVNWRNFGKELGCFQFLVSSGISSSPSFNFFPCDYFLRRSCRNVLPYLAGVVPVSPNMDAVMYQRLYSAHRVVFLVVICLHI